MSDDITLPDNAFSVQPQGGSWVDGRWLPAARPSKGWQGGQFVDSAHPDPSTLPGLNQGPAPSAFDAAAKEMALSLVPGYSTYHAGEIPQQLGHAWSSLKDGHPVNAAGYGALAALGTAGVVGDGLVAASALDGPLAAVTAPAGEALKGISAFGRIAEKAVAPTEGTMAAIRGHLTNTPGGLGDMTKLLTDAHGNPVPIQSEAHAQQALSDMQSGQAPYAPLTRAMGLDTDKAAMQQRAAEAGFNYPGYHSTAFTEGPFTGFDDARLGASTGAPSAKLGHFQATNPDTSLQYLEKRDQLAPVQPTDAEWTNAFSRLDTEFTPALEDMRRDFAGKVAGHTDLVNSIRQSAGLPAMPEGWSAFKYGPGPNGFDVKPADLTRDAFGFGGGLSPDVDRRNRLVATLLEDAGSRGGRAYHPEMSEDGYERLLHRRMGEIGGFHTEESLGDLDYFGELRDLLDAHHGNQLQGEHSNLNYAQDLVSGHFPGEHIERENFPIHSLKDIVPEQHRAAAEALEGAWPQAYESWHQGAMMPYRFKIDNPLEYDFKGGGRTESYADLMRQAKQQGQDGVVFRNTFDGGDFNTDINAILKGRPEQTRLQHAQYNPFWSHLNDNLAGYGAAAGTGAAGAAGLSAFGPGPQEDAP